MITINFSHNNNVYTAYNSSGKLTFGKEKNKDLLSANYTLSYINAVHKIKPLESKEEQKLIQQIQIGKETKEILTFYLDSETLNTDIKNAEIAQKFFKKINPSMAKNIESKLKSGIKNFDLEKYLLDGKTPEEFLTQDKVAKHPYIVDLIENSNDSYVKTITTNIVKSLKKGYEAQELIKRVKLYKKQGKYKENELSQITPNNIPEKYIIAIKNGEEARRKLAEKYARIVPELARKNCKNLNFDDAIQYGNLALYKATETYDPKKGIGFYSYAKSAVIKSINIMANTEMSMMSVTPTTIRDINELITARNAIRQQYNRNATLQEIEEKTKFKPDKQERLTQAKNALRMLSLNSPMDENAKDKTEFGDIVESPKPSAENVLISHKLSLKFRKFINELGLLPSERTVIKEHYLNKETKTLTAIGEARNTGRQNIHQFKESAIKKIKQKFQEAKDCENMPAEKKAEILSAMKNILSLKERQVIRLKLGFYDQWGSVLNYRELGEEINKNSNSARELYLGAMQKLQKQENITEQDVMNCRNLSELNELKYFLLDRMQY